LGATTKICGENQNFLKIGKKYQAFFKKFDVHVTTAGEVKPP